MPEVAFVMSPSQPDPLHELARTLGHELGLQGVPSASYVDGFPSPRPERVYVWLDPYGYLTVEGPTAEPDAAVLRRSVFLYDEHRVPMDDAGHLELARRAGAVFTLDVASAQALHRHGIPARVMRPGYSTALDHYDPDAARPIDIAFLGAHSLRRTRQLSRAARVLSRYRCVLALSDSSPDSRGSAAISAQRKWPLLAQTKVVLNLHCGQACDLEWRRVIDAVHAGAVVVSEHASSLSPLMAGEHLLVASADAVPFVAESLLRDPERLGRLRDQAYERLRTWMPFSLPVSVLRAALVEIVGEPVPPGAWLGRTLSREHGRRAASRPVPTGAPAPPREDPVSPSAEVVHESAAWSEVSDPRVSVLVELRSASHAEARRTLESVLASRLPGCELLVLGDGSLGAMVAAHEWLRSHPEIASRLMRVGGTRVNSVGGIRNAGLAVCRAPFAAILDAGHELYPRCLRVLAEALDDDEDAVFAYPIQEVIGDPEGFVAAGGDFLMSFSSWDHARLRRGNPVHRPALIRTARLHEIGGYATDSRLYGLEDYDLWCRIAERGWRGRLVPQILARRLESGASTVLRSMRRLPGPAIAALAERAPAVLVGVAGGNAQP